MVSGPSCSEGLGDPKIRSLASWYFASRSARVLGVGEGEAEELFVGVVVGVGRLRIFIGAWMIVGGGGVTTVVEVDNLEITSCGIGDFVFLTPVSQSALENPHPEGRERWDQGGVAYAVSQIF